MTLQGEITTYFDALGHALADAEAKAALALVGPTETSEATVERGSTYVSESAFAEGTVFSLKDDRILKIIIRLQTESRYGLYPRPAALIDGIDVGSTREEVVAVLGPSQKALPDSDKFAVGNRFLHVRYRGGTVARLTPMISAR